VALSWITMFISFVVVGGFFEIIGVEVENMPTIILYVVLIPVMAVIAAAVSAIFK